MKILSGNPYIKKENGYLVIDSLKFEEIVKVYDSPVMLFLGNKIRDNIRSFKEISESIFNKCEIFYSVKANYLPEICSIVNSEGIGAEVIGLPELNLALKIGFPPSKILVGGPYLPLELIEKCIESNVKEIIIYNLNDLIQVNKIAKKHNIIQNVCLRVNSNKYDSHLGINFTEDNLKKIKEIVSNSQNIKILTILSHFSSQMNNIDQFKRNLNIIIENLKKLEDLGISIKNVNLGGGFPEATIMPAKQLKKILTEINIALKNTELDSKIIFFEPGRYFVGDSGLIISKIVNVIDHRWIILNIGTHICPKFARCSLRFYNASKIDEPHKFKTSLAGIIPTDQDVLAKNYFFTDSLEENDYVLVTNVGAYCLTFSNRFPYQLPPIFIIETTTIRKIFDPVLDPDFSLR